MFTPWLSDLAYAWRYDNFIRNGTECFNADCPLVFRCLGFHCSRIVSQRLLQLFQPDLKCLQGVLSALANNICHAKRK